MNIASDIKTYLSAQIADLGTITIDSFGTIEASTMVRSDPSAAVEVEFIDGSFTGEQVLSFYARNKNPATAIVKLDTILGKLDMPELTLTGVQNIRVMPRTLPALVSKDDAGVSIYSCSVSVEYDGKNAKGV